MPCKNKSVSRKSKKDKKRGKKNKKPPGAEWANRLYTSTILENVKNGGIRPPKVTFAVRNIVRCWGNRTRGRPCGRARRRKHSCMQLFEQGAKVRQGRDGRQGVPLGGRQARPGKRETQPFQPQRGELRQRREKRKKGSPSVSSMKRTISGRMHSLIRLKIGEKRRERDLPLRGRFSAKRPRGGNPRLGRSTRSPTRG